MVLVVPLTNVCTHIYIYIYSVPRVPIAIDSGAAGVHARATKGSHIRKTGLFRAPFLTKGN